MTLHRDQYLKTLLSLYDVATLEMRSGNVEGGPIGWPARLRVRTASGTMALIDLYLGRVHSHARHAHEFRFQGPADQTGRALEQRNGVVPILLGIDLSEEPYVIVAGNADKYIGSHTRQTVLFDKRILSQTRQSGWSEYYSATGEAIRAFSPEFLPVFIDMALHGLDLPEHDINRTLVDAGHVEDADEETRRRVTVALSRLVRDYRFSSDVVQAYSGRCAISDLNWGIVVAAHIYPVAAPGSNDRISNGIGLTPTYHSLFDKHRIYISPGNYSVHLHPALLQDTSPAARGFLDTTRQTVRLPSNDSQRPDPEMLSRRYVYFGDAYSWAHP